MPAKSLTALLCNTRAALAHIPDDSLRLHNSLQTTMDKLHDQLCCLQDHVDLKNPNQSSLARRGKAYGVTTLINAFMAAHLLKNDSQLKTMCHWCARLVLPPMEADAVVKMLEEKKDAVPSASTIRRARNKIDVAFMLHMRDVIASYFRNEEGIPQEGCAVYMMADKSPQGGREYEMVVLDFIARMRLKWLHLFISRMDFWRAYSL